jgi:hypothetical protein
MTDWSEGEHDELTLQQHWPMAPAHLMPRERWLWWEQVWSDVIMLVRRYGIRAAIDWWENGVAVEALAALAAWVARYDSGEWDDPSGKLSLLYDLERVRELIRGSEPFDPQRDRAAFARFLVGSGGQPPPGPDRISEVSRFSGRRRNHARGPARTARARGCRGAPLAVGPGALQNRPSLAILNPPRSSSQLTANYG